jgi:hypothetical protein
MSGPKLDAGYSDERGTNYSSGNFAVLVGFEVLTAVVMKNYIFWNITLCSPLQVACRALLITCFKLIFFLVSSTMNLEMTCSSETSVDFQRKTALYSRRQKSLLCFMKSQIDFTYEIYKSSAL